MMFQRVVSWLMLVLASMVGASAVVTAQTASSGAIAGTIVDNTGAVLPGVTVTVTSQSTGEARTVHTGADGTYLVPLLSPGTYQIEITLPGFKTVTRPGVQ